MEIVSFTPEHARLARAAYNTVGKGRHPAGLNFGDCASYALAAALGEPLLFKGDDFTKTDVRATDEAAVPRLSPGVVSRCEPQCAAL